MRWEVEIFAQKLVCFYDKVVIGCAVEDCSADFQFVSSLRLFAFNGLDSSFSCFNDAVVYVEATVSSITFTDGTTWTADNIESWADDTTSAFSVDDYKAKVENMKAFSMQAETNPYVKIVAADKYDDNQFSSFF